MMNFLMDGGWMMLPLLICSILLVAVIIDRSRAFRAAAKLDPAALRATVVKLVADGDIAGAVAGGISEALITTAAGLIIAIPGVVAYNMFQKKVEEWNVQLETSVAEFAQAVAP